MQGKTAVAAGKGSFEKMQCVFAVWWRNTRSEPLAHFAVP